MSIAAENRHRKVVKLLLAEDAVDPNSRDKYGWAPLSRAVVTRKKTLIRLLLERGAIDPDSKGLMGPYGRMPLLCGAGNRSAVAKLLLTRNAID